MMTYQDSPIQCSIIITIDKFIDSIMVRGQGAFMAQFDVATVRCNIADHPEDWYLLGVYYVDMALPSGLCSAPFISPLLQMVEWTLTHNHGIDFLCHYLNNLLMLEPA